MARFHAARFHAAVCRAIASLALVATTLATGASAQAEQLVDIRVPLALKSLSSDVEKVSVSCWLVAPDGGMADPNRNDFPVSGSFNGVVSVKLTVSDSSASLCKSYRCQLYFFLKGQAMGESPSFTSYFPAAKAKAGSTLVVDFTRPIPAVVGAKPVKVTLPGHLTNLPNLQNLPNLHNLPNLPKLAKP